MPLPALLLERLKRRKIIRDVTELVNNELVDKACERNLSAPLVDPAQSSATEFISSNQDELEEEIIAEDYSDEQEEDYPTPDKASTELPEQASPDRTADRSNHDSEIMSSRSPDIEQEDDKESTKHITESVLGCPNKYNIYHDCSQYCIDNYSEPKNMAPTLEQRKHLAFLLKTYPMSNEWKVVYDPGVQTFYFWNLVTNLVSWFPPGMNGLVSLSADHIRKTMKEMESAPDGIGS